MDIQYAVKELSRSMANPTEGDMKKAKRWGRCLCGKPRVLTKYLWQEPVSSMTAYSDSDWAGCKSTRRSTSGVIMCLGDTPVKMQSSTQKCRALSSMEAEYYALVKAANQGTGMQMMLADLGVKLDIVLHCDNQSALDFTKKQGLGKSSTLTLDCYGFKTRGRPNCARSILSKTSRTS